MRSGYFTEVLAALVGAGVLALGLAFTPLLIKSEVLKIGAHLCAPNEGLREVVISLRFLNRRYTYVCQNTAHFLDVTVDLVPKSDDLIVKTTEVLK